MRRLAAWLMSAEGEQQGVMVKAVGRKQESGDVDIIDVIVSEEKVMRRVSHQPFDLLKRCALRGHKS